MEHERMHIIENINKNMTASILQKVGNLQQLFSIIFLMKFQQYPFFYLILIFIILYY